MAYPGIDYSLGRSNFDPETGIRFGVIGMGSLGEYALDDIDYDYGDATCPDCGNPAIDSNDVEFDDWDAEKDYCCEVCKKSFWSDRAFSEEPLGWSIDDGDYKVVNCLDSDAMVLRSPYYTYAQYCSPCVPGAGSLDNPVSESDGGVKCYCFGHDWFDDDVAPYPVYSVASGNQVISEEQTTPCPNCNGSGRDTVQRLSTARQTTNALVREQITAGTINVHDYHDDTFTCFRCDGKGTQTEMVTREVQS